VFSQNRYRMSASKNTKESINDETLDK
jgi:hypothetical protein